MSDLLIQAALEARLATLSPAISTAYENGTFKPVSGVAYQRVNFLPNTPDDPTMGRKLTQFRGLFQVTVCYPLGTGRGAAQTQAQAVRDHFAPNQTLTYSTVNVQITETSRIAGGFVDGDRYCVPVTVPWYAWIAT